MVGRRRGVLVGTAVAAVVIGILLLARTAVHYYPSDLRGNPLPPAVDWQAPDTMKLVSSAWSDGGAIPERFTCDGADQSPPLTVSDVPAAVKSLVLVVDDPDAPGGTFVHWLVWNISPATTEIAAGEVPPDAQEGTTDFGRVGYGGPCPPAGTHRYFFRLSALDMILDLPDSATRDQLNAALASHVLAEALLMGTYARH